MQAYALMTPRTMILLPLLLLLRLCCTGQSSTRKATGTVVTSLCKNVLYIHQDKNKHYWFGSHENGLYRYDGRTLVHFTTNDGLPHNCISEIREDEAGNMFFNTTGGICKYDGYAFSKLVAAEQNIIGQNQWKLAQGDLWFKAGIGKNGVYRYDGHPLYYLQFPKHYLEDEYYAKWGKPAFAHTPYDVYYIYTDKRAHVWFGTASLGLCRFDGSTLSWMYEEQLTVANNGGSFGIRSIYEDKNDRFWICNTRYRYIIDPTDSSGLGHKLIRYRKRPGTGPIRSPDGKDNVYVFAFTEDNAGDLWMTTYAEGVWRYNGKHATQYLLKNNGKIVSTYAIYKDKKGTLWLGTHKHGVYRFNGTEFVPFMP